MSVFKDDTLVRLRLEDYQDPAGIKLAACNFVESRLQLFSSLNSKSDFLKNYVERQDKRDEWVQMNCDACEQLINGELEWAKHVKTKKHVHK